MRRTLPVPDPNHRGVFTSLQARVQGWTDSALNSAVRHGHLVRLTKGCFVDARTWTGDAPEDARRRLAIRTAAAQLRIYDAAASHASSAVFAGLPLWDVPDHGCVTVRPRYSGDACAAHLHRATRPAEHLVLGDHGLRTTATRTIFDIAREHDIEDAVVVGDAALAARMTDACRLVACADFCRGLPGSRRAGRAVGLLDPRSESPLESVSRIRMPTVGIPAPEPQVEILSPGGWFLGRVDFYWDEFGVAGEVDGAVKYRDDPLATVLREKRRQEPMDELGLIFVRWGRSDIENMPALARRLRDSFARGARRPRSDRTYLARPSQRFAPEIALLRASWRE